MAHFRLIIPVLLMLNSAVYALHRLPPFALEMTPKQVLSLAGPPRSQTEREVAREVVWEYPDYEVVFHEGKVKHWTGKVEQETSSQRPVLNPQKVPQKIAPEIEKKRNDEVPFGEILDALPKDADPGGQPSAPALIDPDKEISVAD